MQSIALSIRGVGTATATTAMAVPLFQLYTCIYNGAVHCYNTVESEYCFVEPCFCVTLQQPGAGMGGCVLVSRSHASGADPRFPDGGFLLRARKARRKIFGDHAHFSLLAR